MKRISFAILILFFALAACQKENSTSTSTEQAISASELPLSVTTYVSNNYPAESIVAALKVSNATATYIVTLNTLEEVAFDDNGNFLGNGENFHHHGDSLGMDDDSLGFDDDSLGGHHGGGHHGGGHHGGHGEHGEHGEHGNWISLDSLPASISAYVSTNYPGMTLKHAELDSLCQFGAVIEVMVTEQGTQPVKLLFDTSGNFLASAIRAQYATAPQAVIDFIAANYAAYHVKSKMEIFTLADSTQQYSIFLGQEGSRKNVILLADGSLVCER